MKYCYNLATATFALSVFIYLPASADTMLERHFPEFLNAWEGSYDNLRQMQEQDAQQVQKEDRNRPTLLFIKKVDLPAFGPHAYYGEWQDANKPSTVIRQRIYGFKIDDEDQSLRLNLHIWPIQSPEFVARTAGAHLNPDKLNGVTPEDMADLKKCDVYFKKTEDGFAGTMKKKYCSFPAPDGSGAPVYSWSQMTVNKTQFTYLDGWFNMDGSVYRQLAKYWNVFDKKE
jgi:hypothetical protein